MSEKRQVIDQIDARIEETQRLAEEAQHWANRLGSLLNDLAVLKRARELLLRDDVLGEPRTTMEYVPVFAEPPQQESQSASAMNTGAHQRSIGMLLVSVLTEAGSPLNVSTILERIHRRGRPDVTSKSLAGVVSQYLAKGVITRTERATYGLPLTNGAKEATMNES